MAPLVAQEELWALQAAMVEVGWLAGGGALYACKTLRHSLPSRLVDYCQVSDGGFGPTGLGIRQILLQWCGLVRQPSHHKVVRHTMTLVFNHGWMCLEEASKLLTLQ